MLYRLDESLRIALQVDSVEGLQNWTRVPVPQPCETPVFVGQRLASGEWIGEWAEQGPPPVDPLLLPIAERLWRDGELVRADNQIRMLEDQGQDPSAWRAYRVQLRDWPQSEYFPESGHRPEAPA